MRTWPVAVHRTADRVFIGAPDRLGSGVEYRDPEAPSLEEVAGDRWSAQVLACMLPVDRPWAWWATSETVRSSGIPVRVAAASVDLPALAMAQCHKMLRIGMSLVVVPARQDHDQKKVLEWSGADSEQVEHIWTAPAGRSTWEIREILDWCRDEQTWRDPRSVPGQPAERIQTTFDGYHFLSVPVGEGAAVLEALEHLAREWGIDLVTGSPDHAWVTPPT
jgi:hypothetical protein